MQIKKIKGIKTAEEARGVTVVIDIIRAAATEAFMLSQGAAYIIPVEEKEEAIELKKKNPEFLLAGEQNGIKIDGFDLGNSPSEVLKADLRDRVIVHRSTMGTRTLTYAKNATELIFGSFVTAGAIARYIKDKNPGIVSIVSPWNDDEIFANFLEDLLLGKEVEMEKCIKDIKDFPYIDGFFDKNNSDFPEEDFFLCMDLDRFDFICRVKREGNILKTIRA